jgi:hypothetical protein
MTDYVWHCLWGRHDKHAPQSPHQPPEVFHLGLTASGFIPCRTAMWFYLVLVIAVVSAAGPSDGPDLREQLACTPRKYTRTWKWSQFDQNALDWSTTADQVLRELEKSASWARGNRVVYFSNPHGPHKVVDLWSKSYEFRKIVEILEPNEHFVFGGPYDARHVGKAMFRYKVTDLRKLVGPVIRHLRELARVRCKTGHGTSWNAFPRLRKTTRPEFWGLPDNRWAQILWDGLALESGKDD